MARCFNCGAELGEGQQICPKCGAAMPSETPKGSYENVSENLFSDNMNSQVLKKSHTALAVVFLLLFYPAGIAIMWTMTTWPKKVKIGLTVACAILFVVGIIFKFTSSGR